MWAGQFLRNQPSVIPTQNQARGGEADGVRCMPGTIRQGAGKALWKIQQELQKEKDKDPKSDSAPAAPVAKNEWVLHSEGWRWNEALSMFHNTTTDTYYNYNSETKEYTATANPDAPQQTPEFTLNAESTTMQGRRPKQEDRHVMIKDLIKVGAALKMPLDHLPQPCAMFGVYDGHQGHLCAEWCAKTMHTKIVPALHAYKGTWDDERVREMFEQAISAIDTEFLEKYRTAKDGSTAVVALVVGHKLYCAGVGDSRAIVGRRRDGRIEALAMTVDHKPKDDAERIKAAGGIIINKDGIDRVATADYEETIRRIRAAQAQGLGTMEKEPIALAICRAVGDRHFKIPLPLLVCTPTVKSLDITPETEFLTLMCDGISDVMTNQEVADTVALHQGKPRAASGAVVQGAYTRGSYDNLTVITIFFQRNEETVEPVAKKRKIEQVRARHILLKHKDVRNPVDKARNKPITRTLEEAQLELTKILEELQDPAAFPRLARERSECQSALKGGEQAGDLGWFTRGKMQKAFEQAAFDLEVNQISDLVITESGVHIIQRLA